LSGDTESGGLVDGMWVELSGGTERGWFVDERQGWTFSILLVSNER